MYLISQLVYEGTYLYFAAAILVFVGNVDLCLGLVDTPTFVGHSREYTHISRRSIQLE